MRHTAIIVIGLAAGLMGCSDPLASGADLDGKWSSGRMSAQPRGSWEVVLAFSPDGRFSQTISHYGTYAGTSLNTLAAQTIVAGTYTVVGDRLEMSPDTYTWLDTFYEDPGPHSSEPPATLYDDCTYGFVGSALTLRYTSYPADAPIATTAAFVKMR